MKIHKLKPDVLQKMIFGEHFVTSNQKYWIATLELIVEDKANDLQSPNFEIELGDDVLRFNADNFDITESSTEEQ